MPTSSIFASFSIKDKETAERFIDALEQSANDPERTPTSENSVHISDKEKILKLFIQRKKAAEFAAQFE